MLTVTFQLFNAVYPHTQTLDGINAYHYPTTVRPHLKACCIRTCIVSALFPFLCLCRIPVRPNSFPTCPAVLRSSCFHTRRIPSVPPQSKRRCWHRLKCLPGLNSLRSCGEKQHSLKCRGSTRDPQGDIVKLRDTSPLGMRWLRPLIRCFHGATVRRL